MAFGDDFNRFISDPLDDLAGRNGVIEYEGPLTVLTGGGNRYFQLPAGTTAQQPAGPRPGTMRFNRSLSRGEYWNGSSWRSLIQSLSVITYSAFSANGAVGSGSNQVSRGNHGH